mgnify:FL=1
MSTSHEWHPAPSPLKTRWADRVDPACPLPEYPRPQLTRPDWQNLNGLWEYTIQPADSGIPGHFDGTILVPFPLESSLSGVAKPLDADEKLWYFRTFTIPEKWQGQAILLHFGAVDWQTNVWLNGIFIGSHSGGYLPFTFDLTQHVRFFNNNELIISVADPSDDGMQARGKQTLHPRGIWYTSVSGIWQTVWLEAVPPTSIRSLTLTPDLDTRQLHISLHMQGQKQDNLLVEAVAYDQGMEIARAYASLGQPLAIPIMHPKPWSPGSPHLYDLTVKLLKDGKPVDEIGSYFAMRSYRLGLDSRGHTRFELNHEPLFLYGPLDQGYFPDGLYTAPTDEALRFDIEFTRTLGMNMIRKHVKVEPARWYYHCDRLGMIVWQDMPNGGKPVGGFLSTLAIGTGYNERDEKRWKRAGRIDPENRTQFEAELRAMIQHLYNFPCIAVWVPFNEGWGQYQSTRIAKLIKTWDPTRLVDAASGWFDQGAGDFESRHIYNIRLQRRKPHSRRAFVISEFGGYSLKIPGHLWNPGKKFGYKFYPTEESLVEAYIAILRDELKPLIREGLAAAIYTQTTDVEIEINGFLTYDREVEKIPASQVTLIHQDLIANASGKR